MSHTATPRPAPPEPAAGTETGAETGAGPARRRVIVLTVAAVVAGAAGGGWVFGYGPLARHAQPVAQATAVPTSLATVARGTITASENDAGTLGYEGSFTCYSGLAGTVTWLPAAGAVVHPGHPIVAVDGQDVVLLRGPAPAWRAFGPGMSDGGDVAELQRNLVALGYDPAHEITAGDHYNWATQAAIERWQAARGLPQDGQIPVGQVLFAPWPVRVATLSTGTGATVAPGAPVLAGTSTTAVVDVAVPAADQARVTPGQRVTMTMPDGSVAHGHVQGPAQAAPGAVPGAAPGAASLGSPSSSGSPQQAATVTVVVGFDGQPAPAGPDGTAVQAAITTQAQRDALIVPISALLARPGGGFQVTVVTGRAHRNVTVQTGLFDDGDGVVAVTGPGITAGTRVEVPQS